MIGKSDPAKAYAKACKALGEAEKAFQSLLDAVQRAREAEAWDSVPGLRKRAMQAEAALDDALSAARQAHSAYWKARMVAEIPNLRGAALTFRRFARIARCAGDNDMMARGTFDAFEFQPDELDPSEDVPTESPDSALCWSPRDPMWKPRY